MSLCLRLELWVPWLAALAWGCADATGPVLGDTPSPPSPAPLPPVPTPDQLAWQTQELTAFLHFGMDTFTNQEQGDGTASPSLFAPTALDASQWMTTLRAAGFGEAMLTAKHFDGFCLWPSNCTDYTVAASSWLDGEGDVVRQFVDAAHEANLRVGLALSPLDHHDPTYGTPAYYSVFTCQLTELLTNYGAIDEMWLWDDPASAPAFDWSAVHELVHQLQPHALLDLGGIAMVAGSDVRSVAEALPAAPPADQPSVEVVPGSASPAPIWYPAEAVYSDRPGWFWHASEDTQVASLTQLLEYYYDSVGRNSVFRLNVPPNTQGLLASPDVAALQAYGPAMASIYQTNFAEGQSASADSTFDGLPAYDVSKAVDGDFDTFWAAGEDATTARLEVDLGATRTFNVVSLQEPIGLGERTTQHSVAAQSNGSWTTIATGTVIGERKLHRVGTITANRIALVITQARGAPAIAEIGAYASPYP